MEDSISSKRGRKKLRSEDSRDEIEIIGEQPSGRRIRKSARTRTKRGEVSVLDDLDIISPEPALPSKKRSSNSDEKIKNKKKHAVVEEINLDDSFDLLNTDEDEDELNPEVSVKVIWKSVDVKKFLVRKFQKMSKVYQELSKEENVPEEKILLTFNNVRVRHNDTPDSLNLQIYHFIDGGVLSELTNVYEPLNPSTILKDSNSIILKFQNIANKIVKIILSKDQKMKIGMIKCAEQLEVPLKKMKFIFDGELLDPSETPTSLGLEGDEIIDYKILP